MVRSLTKRAKLALTVIFSLVFVTLAPPTPVLADIPVAVQKVTITNTSANVTIIPLTGQSSCNTEIVGTAAGTTQGLIQGTWVNVNSVAIPDGTSAPSPTLTGAGSYTANCASFQGFRFVPTSVTGSATITLVATSGVGRVIGAGVNGGKTTVAGATPITVTNSGSTATVGISNNPSFQNVNYTGDDSVPLFFWQNSNNPLGLQKFAFDSYNALNVASIVPNAWGTDLYFGPGSNNFIQALDATGNMGIAGKYYSAAQAGNSGKCAQFGANGVIDAAASACGAGSVTGLTAGLNIAVGSGATPSVATIASPVFTNVTASALTASRCVQTGVGGLLSVGTGACLVSGAAATVTSLTSSVLTASRCVQTSTGGLLTAAANTCAVTGAPASFTTVTASTLTPSKCVVTSTGGLLATTANTCATIGTLFIPFGFYGGPVNTVAVYPFFQTPAYTAGQITTLRVACATADNGTTVFTFKDITGATTIGTITMANAATTATLTLGTPYTLVTGRVLNAVVTTAGTATSCGLTAEGTYTLS